MGSDEKNLMSDGNVQIVKTGEVVGATQLTDGELIIEAGGRAENTIVTGAGWLKVEAGGIARGHSTATMARYQSVTGPLPQILFSPTVEQLAFQRSLLLMAAILKVNLALIRAMPAVCCWRTAVTCAYWKVIGQKKSFSIRLVVCWLTEQLHL